MEIRYIGGPTAVLELGGLRLLTDPTFDPPGDYPIGERVLTKQAGGGTLRVTGVPARHGPDGSEHLVGEVTGFVLSGDDLPTVYVSGDNASLEVVRAIAARVGQVDVAVLFAGGARTPLLGDAYLTLPSSAAAEAAEILGARWVVPLHFEHWAHFTQGRDTLEAAFADRPAGFHLLTPGAHATLV